MTFLWTSKRKEVCLAQALLFLTLLMGLVSCKNGEPQPSEVQNKSRTYNEITFHKLIVAPYYNEEENHPDAYFKAMQAMATNGSTILISSAVYPIVQMRDGQFQGLLGNTGEGPGEYRLPVLALASHGNETLVLTQKSIQWYQDGHFIEGFPLPGNRRALWPLRMGMGANSFDFKDGLILLPVGLSGRPGDIASVLDYGGELLHIINDPEFTEENLHLSAWSQKTLWQHHEDKWYCVYQFTGEMLIFDEAFTLIERINLESPEIRDYRDNFYQEDREGLANPDRNIPLFFTFQVFNDKLFLGGQKYLHSVNKGTGKVEHLVQFWIHEDGETKLSAFPFFCILDDGVFVGGNTSFGGELFSAPLPQQIFVQSAEVK